MEKIEEKKMEKKRKKKGKRKFEGRICLNKGGMLVQCKLKNYLKKKTRKKNKIEKRKTKKNIEKI